jgi:hypothetical protein
VNANGITRHLSRLGCRFMLRCEYGNDGGVMSYRGLLQSVLDLDVF